MGAAEGKGGETVCQTISPPPFRRNGLSDHFAAAKAAKRSVRPLRRRRGCCHQFGAAHRVDGVYPCGGAFFLRRGHVVVGLSAVVALVVLKKSGCFGHVLWSQARQCVELIHIVHGVQPRECIMRCIYGCVRSLYPYHMNCVHGLIHGVSSGYSYLPQRLT